MKHTKEWLQKKVARSSVIKPKKLKKHPCRDSKKQDSCQEECSTLFQWNMENKQ